MPYSPFSAAHRSPAAPCRCTPGHCLSERHQPHQRADNPARRRGAALRHARLQFVALTTSPVRKGTEALWPFRSTHP
jgi:hypothetical protein